jgi:hypothetical protein
VQVCPKAKYISDVVDIGEAREDSIPGHFVPAVPRLLFFGDKMSVLNRNAESSDAAFADIPDTVRRGTCTAEPRFGDTLVWEFPVSEAGDNRILAWGGLAGKASRLGRYILGPSPTKK